MRNVTRLFTACSVVAALAILSPTAAYAAGSQPCKADLEKLCPGMKPGTGEAMACLKEHEADVSAACKQKLSHAKAKVDALKQACGEDAKKFCPDVKPGGGALAKCLSSHQADLSPSCQQAVSAAHEKLGAFKKACGDDVKKLCPGMKPGGGKIMACLQANEAQLSPTCATAMKSHGAAQPGGGK